jgi:hypothetical protein
MEQTINAVDYQINYHGKLTEIEATKKVLALLIKGSGVGDNEANYRGGFAYYLYQVDESGKVLNKIGEGYTNINGYDISCGFDLNDQKATFKGVRIEEIFTSIFKRKKQN